MNHLLGNWEAVAIARDPEGIHQMRVAIRRLRSALGLFGGPFRAALHPLEDDLRWLARVLGAARDLDVFDDEVFRPAADAHGEDVRFAALTATVRARRQDAWNDVLAVLASERFRRLMLSLAAAALGKAWLENATKAAGRPAALLARKRIAKRHAQAVKVGKKIEELDAQSRHKLRIRLKKLRYAVEFFSSLFPKGAVGTYLARLAALQEVLGHMNDAAVARSVVDGFLAGEQENAADVGYTCGVIAGWHLGHWREHRKALRRRWRSFAHLKPLWK